MKYFKIQKLTCVTQKSKLFQCVIWVYPNETGRQQKKKERGTRPAPFCSVHSIILFRFRP